jgi:uncharacterized membrane protein
VSRHRDQPRPAPKGRGVNPVTEIETVPPDPRMVKLVYALFLLSLLFGPILFAALAIAYEQKRHAAPLIASHYRFQIRTAWLSMLFALVIVLPALVVIGAAAMGMASPNGLIITLCGTVIFAVLMWWIVRCGRGLMLANKEQAIPNPASWLFGG